MVFCPTQRVTILYLELTQVLLLVHGLHPCFSQEFYLVLHLRILNNFIHQVNIKLVHLVTMQCIHFTLDYLHMEKNIPNLLILHFLGGNHMTVYVIFWSAWNDYLLVVAYNSRSTKVFVSITTNAICFIHTYYTCRYDFTIVASSINCISTFASWSFYL